MDLKIAEPRTPGIPICSNFQLATLSECMQHSEPRNVVCTPAIPNNVKALCSGRDRIYYEVNGGDNVSDPLNSLIPRLQKAHS